MQQRTRAATRPTAPAWALVAAALVIVGVAVAGRVIVATPAVTAWDLGLLQELESVRSPALVAVSLGMSWLFSPAVSVVLLVVLAGLTLAVTRRVTPPVLLVVLAALPWLGNTLLKQLVQRPRPDQAELPHHLLTSSGTFSYPGGHTAFATALCLALVIVAGRGRWRRGLVVVAVVVPLLTAFARMYAGVHNLTDVVASLLYASAAVLLLWAAASAVLGRFGRLGRSGGLGRSASSERRALG